MFERVCFICYAYDNKRMGIRGTNEEWEWEWEIEKWEIVVNVHTVLKKSVNFDKTT